MGAEAVKKLLQRIDLEKESKMLRDDLKDSTGQKRVRTMKKWRHLKPISTTVMIRYVL